MSTGETGLSIVTQLMSDPNLLEAMKLISTITGTKILTVKNEEQERSYTEMAVQCKSITKAVETRRKELVDPHNRVVKSINDYVKTNFAIPIETKGREIGNALVRYRAVKAEEARKLQAKADEMQAKLQKQAEKAGIDVPVPTIQMPTPDKVTRVEGGQVHERKQMVIEITDLKALAGAVAAGTIPENVITANLSAIRSLLQGGMSVPGVTVSYQTALTVRT